MGSRRSSNWSSLASGLLVVRHCSGADATPRSSRYEARATSERAGREFGRGRTKPAAPVAAIRAIAGVANFPMVESEDGLVSTVRK